MKEQVSKEVGVFLIKSEGEGDNLARRRDLSILELGLRGGKQYTNRGIQRGQERKYLR